MRRTITMENTNTVFYRGKRVDYMLSSIRKHFGLKDSRIYKYVISIIASKTGRYTFVHNGDMYEIYDGEVYVSAVCKEHFVKIFFRPWVRKRYDITVTKVRIRKNRQSEKI